MEIITRSSRDIKIHIQLKITQFHNDSDLSCIVYSRVFVFSTVLEIKLGWMRSDIKLYDSKFKIVQFDGHARFQR